MRLIKEEGNGNLSTVCHGHNVGCEKPGDLMTFAEAAYVPSHQESHITTTVHLSGSGESGLNSGCYIILAASSLGAQTLEPDCLGLNPSLPFGIFLNLFI